MKVSKVILAVVGVALIISVIGCTGASEDAGTAPGTVPDEKVDIRGEITSTSENGGTITAILVEGAVEEDTGYDKAHITITGETDIYKGAANSKASSDDLREGVTVEVRFAGAVAESYPVQAAAEFIRIVE